MRRGCSLARVALALLLLAGAAPGYLARAAAAPAPAPALPRHVVAFGPGSAAEVERGIQSLGLTIAVRAHNWFAVEPAGKASSSSGSGGSGGGIRIGFAGAKEAAYVDNAAAALARLNGVTRVERDAAYAVGGGAAQVTGNDWLDGLRATTAPVDCQTLDKVEGDNAFPEVKPYYLDQVQATAPLLKAAVPSAGGKGVLICVIDSGVDKGHPEFKSGPDQMDGCKAEDAAAPAGCPFEWSEDITGHGTHVSGILAAPKNGRGVIGVNPDGADLYYVRIFNNTGDVNQGQGFVYGSTLILAYTQCEGKLAYLQASEPDKRWRMVVTMSVGAPGPLTIEKMFFNEATKRDDMLFIGSTGNNGTDRSQWLNYPSAYAGVVAVGAVNCRNEVQPWSQKNARVDIVAPGADILSTYPVAKSASIGATMGYAAYGNASYNNAPGAFFSGIGAFTGALADCGAGDAPCPAAAGAVCMVQPRVIEVKGADGTPHPDMPNTCSLVKRCVDAGAKAVVLVPPAFVPEYGAYPRNFVTPPNLDCTIAGKFKCACWSDSLGKLAKDAKLPPVVAVTIEQADAMRATLKRWQADAAAAQKAGAKARAAPEARVATQVGAYRRMSGTSMATPVVSGIAARVWAAFPRCTAGDVKKALMASAKDLGPPGWDKDSGYGLVQAEAAYKWLRGQPCAAPVPSPPPASPSPQPAAASKPQQPVAAASKPQQPQQQQQQQQPQKQQQPAAKRPAPAQAVPAAG